MPPEDSNEPPPPVAKLDLCYFTTAERCPRMVRHQSRRAFELFLFLADGCLQAGGEPFTPEHGPLCRACGVDPSSRASRSMVSHALRRLADTYGVVAYEVVPRRRPRLRLRPAVPGADPMAPPRYVYFAEGWDGQRRELFHRAGPRAFAAEYLYWIAQYEAALARAKQGRPYWFFPLERLAETFHISPRFASMGLQGLVELGLMHVAHGRRDRTPVADEFGRANRYYFVGLEGHFRRRERLERLADEQPECFPLAEALARELTNGQTVRNVEGLCALVRRWGEARVREAVGQVAAQPRRSARRRLAYIEALLESGGAQGAD